jgi:hypothetical protein
MRRRTVMKFLRPEIAVVLVVAGCLVALSARSEPSRAAFDLTAGGGGSLTLSNDKEGAAILSLVGMRPGDSVTDTVTLGNTGTVSADFSLDISNLVDTPGPGGGALSGELDLLVRDITSPGSPVPVYTGKIGALTPIALGSLSAGDSRVYEFRVSFPDAGPGAENAYQGSSMSVQFDWAAVDNSTDTDPPQTTITSRPAALSASPNATFAFNADEPGSTFECSLDGAGFAPCTSPASYPGLADGSHTFDVRATDASTNTDPTPDNATWTVDDTAPIVSLDDPGSLLHGTVALAPTADDGTGSGIAAVTVQRSPSGAGTWTAIGTSWNTKGVDDGVYDLRARATDNAGNTAVSPLRTVTVDNGAPSKPKKFSARKRHHRLVLRWKAATDQVGPISAYLVYANGSLVKTLPGSARSVRMGRFKRSDARAFRVAARDAAGNVGSKTRALVIIPRLARLTVAQAQARLKQHGLRVGAVKYASSTTVRAGLVIHARSGVAQKGSVIRLVVSDGHVDQGNPRPTTGGHDGTSGYTGGYTGGYQPGTGFGTPVGGSGNDGEPPTPTPTPTQPSFPPADGDDNPVPTTGSGETESGDVVPQSFSADDESSSSHRRLLGLLLLFLAFSAALTMAIRAGWLRRRRYQDSTAVEPLVFWDQRLLHAVNRALRRVSGRP